MNGVWAIAVISEVVADAPAHFFPISINCRIRSDEKFARYGNAAVILRRASNVCIDRVDRERYRSVDM